MKNAFRTLFLALITAGVSACNHSVEAAATPPPTTLTAANKVKAAEVARGLVQQDRAAQAMHRAQMDRLIRASIIQVRDGDRETAFVLQVYNLTAKTIRALDAGVQVRLLSNGRRVGLTELHVKRLIAGNSQVTFSVPLRYVRFGEDTASMRLAQGQPKRAQVQVTEIRYTDGSDVGYDD